MNLPKMGARGYLGGKGWGQCQSGDKLRKFIVAIVAAVVAGGSGLVLTHEPCTR